MTDFTYFWRGEHWKCVHDSIGIFLADFGNQKSSKTWSGSASQWMGQLETLKTIAIFRFLAHDIQHKVDELGTFSVVTLIIIIGQIRNGLITCYILRDYTLAQLFPAPDCPKTKLSGLNNCPYGEARTESMVPGSKSTSTARGTNLFLFTSL